MKQTLFVHDSHAFTSKIPFQETEPFSYSGKTPEVLWSVEGSGFCFLADSLDRALSELSRRGAGHRLTEIAVHGDWNASPEAFVSYEAFTGATNDARCVAQS